MLEQNILHIYTDGSSYARPRRGGYAVRFVYLDSSNEEKSVDYDFPGTLGATNNQMELRACIKGLEEAVKFDILNSIDKIIVFTDSMYIAEYYTHAMFQWPKTKWIGRDGPILNVELWKDLIKKIKQLSLLRKNVSIKWVKGHAKNIHNKAVDAMAKKSAQNCTDHRISIVTTRKRKFKNDPSSINIKPCGQKFTIKIFTSEYLREHKLYKYGYEVVSRKSNYYKGKGLIYFHELLRTRHSYLVSLSDRENSYMISKIHRVYGKPTIVPTSQ